jgi:serine/threonine protein phosphatase PrpC
MKGYETAWRLDGTVEGHKRENEDRIGVCETHDALVLVVADGVGGRSGGGAASKRAVEIVRKAVTGERPNDEAQIWAERVAGIDRLLSRDKEAGETTLVVAAVTTGRAPHIVGASVGDSGAWIVTTEGVDDLTRRQAHKPYLGSSAALPVPFDAVWNEGTLLLATDGLFKYTDRDRILAAVRVPDLDEAAQNLVELVRLPDGTFQDDVGILLCRRESQSSSSSSRKSGRLLKSVGKLLNWGRRD